MIYVNIPVSHSQLQDLKYTASLKYFSNTQRKQPLSSTKEVSPSADEVEAFFIPVFSKNEGEKAEEELVIYNWGKCLKNIESKLLNVMS